MREPREFQISIGDIDLSVFEWSGESDPILLLHATGFHSRCWNQVVEKLPGQRIYAIDIHFHGASSNAGIIVDWNLFTADICELVERLDLKRIVGVGHSMGGYLMARAAAALPDRFRHVVLLDPVIFAPLEYENRRKLYENFAVNDHPVSRRKNHWRDAQEMYQRFIDRPPYNTWLPEVLSDYCNYALKPQSDSQYLQLACDPINEAFNYINSVNSGGVLNDLPSITMPVTLLRAPPGNSDEIDFSASPTWPELASILPDCTEFYLPNMNHFIPMQDPELVARYILEAQETP